MEATSDSSKAPTQCIKQKSCYKDPDGKRSQNQFYQRQIGDGHCIEDTNEHADFLAAATEMYEEVWTQEEDKAEVETISQAVAQMTAKTIQDSIGHYCPCSHHQVCE